MAGARAELPTDGDGTTPPEAWRPAAVAETHISTVVFVGDRAYKLKKPVDLGFLDFSTREVRQAICHREVDLNRRLAPDVYLGVADVVGPDGELCDHLVVMRRMPDDRRLSTLVRAAAPGLDRELAAVARTVARFHAAAPTSPEVAEAATRDALLAHWEQSFEQMAPFAGSVLDADDAHRVEELARRYLAGRRRLFDRRIAEGWARDGHGDLLADDVFCLPDGPRILDCIEFSDRLRHGDVLLDVAFLVMDLEDLGAPAAAERLLHRWSELLGEQHPASLADHYVGYRAHVRSKVACLRHAQGDDAADAPARRLLARARAHLERSRVRLVLVGGAPGTGKSTLASSLAAARGWTLLGSDVVRKELADLPADADAHDRLGEGIYREAMTDATYAALLGRAAVALAHGETVVIDATWTDQAMRQRAKTVAEEASADLVALRCDVPPPVAAARLSGRTPGGASGSDAYPAIGEALRAAAAPWPSAVVIDTTGPLAETLGRALAVVDAAPPSP